MTRNILFRRRHLELNRLANVEVCGEAGGEMTGALLMSEGDSPSDLHPDPASRLGRRVPADDTFANSAFTCLGFGIAFAIKRY